MGIGISRIHVCQDFLSQARVSAAMLLIVKYWLKWVKKGMWMNFSLELIMLTGSPNTKHTLLPLIVMD